MRLLLDIPRLLDRPLGMHLYVECFLKALLSNLNCSSDINVVVLANGIRGHGVHTRRLAAVDPGHKAAWWWYPVPSRVRAKKWFAALPYLPGQFDVVHSMSGLPLPKLKSHQIVTIQDVIPIRLNEGGADFARECLRIWRLVVPNCQQIVTISQFSKSELCDALNVPPDRVSVIYNGVDHDWFKPLHPAEDKKTVLTRLGLDSHPYIVHLGGTIERKNTVRVVKAFELLRLRSKVDAKLVFAGGNMTEELKKAVNESAVAEDIMGLGYLSSPDALAVLQQARLLICASTYEGFGLPPLEAMSCGVPVALSTAASLPEVGGDAVIYFDPMDIEAMCSAMQRLMVDDDLRARSIELGLAQSAKFSWHNNARETLSLYQTTMTRARSDKIHSGGFVVKG